MATNESNPIKRNIWDQIRLFVRVIMLTRFSLLLAAVAIVVALTDQGQDVLRAMGESPSPLRYAILVAATVLCAFSAWYFAWLMYLFHFDQEPTSAANCFPGVKKHYPRVLGVAVILFVAFALLSASQTFECLVLVGILLVCTIVFIAFVWNHKAEIKDLKSLRQLPPRTKTVVLLLLVINIALFFAFRYMSFDIAVTLGTLPIILIAGATLIPVGTLLVYLGLRYRFPSVILVFVLAFIFSFFNDNHLVRLHPDMNSHSQLTLPEDWQRPLQKYSSLNHYYQQWIDDLKPARSQKRAYRSLTKGAVEAPTPVIIIATEGGGIRAAYWTAAVLARLQDLAREENIDFARHVFAISGVSGGSLGAATFAALLRSEQGNIENCPFQCEGDSYQCRAQAMLSQDYLAPTVGALLFPDALQRFLPRPVFNDRAMALEQSWEAGWKRCEASDWLTRRFEELWQTNESYPQPFPVPLLFLNSTIVETGQRLIVHPVNFSGRTVSNPNSFPAIFNDALDSGTALSSQIPLSTAALLSARFTYVSPAGTFQRQDLTTQGEDKMEYEASENRQNMSESRSPRWVRAVDGGYFENSGAVTATEILLTINRLADRRGDNIQPIVIHISNEPRRASVEQEDDSGQSVYLSELLSPVRTLLHTRSARGFQARDLLRERIRARDDIKGTYLHFQLCDFDVNLPLGWSLSDAAQNDMNQQLSGYQEYPERTSNQHNLQLVINLLKGDTTITGVPQSSVCQK